MNFAGRYFSKELVCLVYAFLSAYTFMCEVGMCRRENS